MSFFACGCGANSKHKRRAKSMTNSELHSYKQKFRFADNELLEFRQRFNFLADTRGLIDKPSFIESMGVLGLDSGAFLSERIFKVMDNDMDGYIRLDEYLGYFDVLIYGTQEEKYELTFRMIDTERKGWFNFDDFYEMITSMLHIWNNITGHNYNILDNKKLAQFLQAIFHKFNLRRSDRVTFDDFKRAVSREPELLEIFDYFNEGIIDTVQPLSEFEHQNQALIQELEQLHSKVNNLRALIRGRGNNLFEEIQTGIQKVNSLRGGRTSVIPGLLAHSKNDEAIMASGGLSPANFERKPSMLQSLDTKIRRTALFEHLRRDTEGDDDLPLSASMSKARSAVIKQDPDRNRSYRLRTETFENLMRSEELDLNGKKVAGSAGNAYKNTNAKRNTLDRALEATSIRPKKPTFLGNAQASPDKDPLSNSARMSSSNQNAQQVDPNMEAPNQGQEQKEDFSSIGYEVNRMGLKENLGVIKEEKTFTVDTLKISEMKTQILQQDTAAPNFGLKLSGEAFPGVLLDSQRPEDLKVTISKEEEGQGENRESITQLQGAKHKRPDTVMVEQKFLELEDIDVIQSKMVSEGLVSGLHPGFQLDDVKMADSFIVASGESSRYDAHDGSNKNPRRVSKSQGPNLKVSAERANEMNEGNIKIPNTPDDERYRQIAMQVDLIAEETLRIMEEIHQKRRNANNNNGEKNEEVKKIEMMREMTAHNIPKSARVKDNKKGSFVSFGHQNWNLVLNMMIGIKVAVKSAVERPETLTLKDFKLKYIFELIPKRTSEVKDNYKICTFFDYAPGVFLEIRRLFGIKNEDYLRSIGPESMLNGLIKGSLATLAELTSSGKSGSFFYYSADGKYTLKTISRDEFHFLRKILTSYYDHIMNNPNTLMIKFFGLHKVRFMKGPQRKTKLYIIIMANVFNTSREIHIRYDLKGSTQGRITRDEDPSIALKDLNIIQKKEKILLSKEMAETFLQTIEKDAQFFDENSIIDYSLLMGIHYLEQEEMMTTKDWSAKKITNEFKMQSKEGILSADGTKIYFFGVIDILTQFNAKKRAEYMVKRVAYGKGISAVPPSDYAQRFKKFIRSLVETPGK